MSELLFGVETEYAVAGVSRTGAVPREQILYNLMAQAREHLIHLPDLYAGSGIFLQNGGRFYVDCGLHPELCTPECTNPWDVVRYIQAGHRILAQLASQVQAAATPAAEIMAFRCNVAYSGEQTTWGCHESYLHRRPQEELQPQVIPHLVTRLIYTGAGGFNPITRRLEFALSPRVAHFSRLITESSTSERGIWHNKGESLCAGYRRLHVLCGESLCSEIANFLKIGVTALIVAMADAGLTPGTAVQLADPLAALHLAAGDVTCRVPLPMADGCHLPALAIQRHYLEQAEAHLFDNFMPPWAADVCQRWRAILDQLEDAPASVAQTLDWGIKLALYANHAQSLGIRWDELPFLNQFIDKVNAALVARKRPGRRMTLEAAIGSKRPMPEEVAALEPLLHSRGLDWSGVRALVKNRHKLFEVDMRFGQLGPRGVFEMLDSSGVLNHHISGVDNIEQAITQPPAHGRARLRGQVIRRLAGTDGAQCDWQSIYNPAEKQALDLSDPFATEESWHPMNLDNQRDRRRPRALDEIFSLDPDAGSSNEQDPYSRRVAALHCYQTRNYAGAVELLRPLVGEQYEVASNRCHLARSLILMDRIEEARQEVSLAEDALEGAPSYVLTRILFFKWLFAILDGVDVTLVRAQLQEVLRAQDRSSEWTIQPMLDYLRPRLGDSDFRFLTALAKALSNARAMPHLDQFPQWQRVPVTPRRVRTGACA